MSKPAARQPLEGAAREFVALLDGKQQAMHHQTAERAFIEARSESWQMCSILQLVYAAGSWHHEKIVARYMRMRDGKVVPMMKMSDTTHTNRSHGGQQR